MLLGPEHSARRTEHVPFGFTWAKDGLKQAEKVLSRHTPVILGSLPQCLRKPETSDFLNQYFLIIIPNSLSIRSREIFISNMYDLYKVSQGNVTTCDWCDPVLSTEIAPQFLYIWVKRLPYFVILNAVLDILLNQVRTIPFC